MDEFCSNAELSSSQPLYPTLASTTEVFLRDIEVAGAGTYRIISNAPYQGRISSVNVIATAGSGVFNINIAGINVTGLVDKSVTINEADYIPTDLNLFSVDQDINFVLTSCTGLLRVSITISVLRDTGTAVLASTSGGTESGTSASFLEKVSAALPQGFILADIPFSATKLDENGNPTSVYNISYEPIENLTDTVPDRLFPTVVGRSSTKITILLSATPTTPNSIFRATIATAGAANTVIASSASSGDVATTPLPLRGDNSGGAIPITPQTGDAATGLATLNLFSSTPTYDPAKISGLIPQSKLGSGSGGAGTKVLYDDQTYKTISATGGGNVATDAIFDSQGDLAVGTNVDTAVRLPAGLDNTVLIADSSISPGLKYAQITDLSVAVANKDGLPATPSMRTLGPGPQQSPSGDDPRITGALQAANSLSEITDVEALRNNIHFGTVVYENMPDGGDSILFLAQPQAPTNKYIDANANTIVNLTAANFSGAETTLELIDPNNTIGLIWDDTNDTFALPVISIAGSNGSRTANTLAGTVKFAASATSLTLTNSYIVAGTYGITSLQTADATAFSCAFAAGSGSAVLTLNAAATGVTVVYWELRGITA